MSEVWARSGLGSKVAYLFRVSVLHLGVHGLKPTQRSLSPLNPALNHFVKLSPTPECFQTENRMDLQMRFNIGLSGPNYDRKGQSCPRLNALPAPVPGHVVLPVMLSRPLSASSLPTEPVQDSQLSEKNDSLLQKCKIKSCSISRGRQEQGQQYCVRSGEGTGM